MSNRRPLQLMPHRAGRRGAMRWHIGITLGATHSFQFQSLISFETLSEALLALDKANKDESYRRELYGWKGSENE